MPHLNESANWPHLIPLNIEISINMNYQREADPGRGFENGVCRSGTGYATHNTAAYTHVLVDLIELEVIPLSTGELDWGVW
jgi:hypothetical protein